MTKAERRRKQEANRKKNERIRAWLANRKLQDRGMEQIRKDDRPAQERR